MTTRAVDTSASNVTAEFFPGSVPPAALASRYATPTVVGEVSEIRVELSALVVLVAPARLPNVVLQFTVTPAPTGLP
ncbi:hypothetical protein D3C72_2470010 [compost metagenome]